MMQDYERRLTVVALTKGKDEDAEGLGSLLEELSSGFVPRLKC